MSAETLRKAAEKLRGLVGTPSEESEDFTIPGPWGVSGRPGKFEVVPELDESYDVVAHTEYELEAVYIATMHPGVGLALADWLTKEAMFADVGDEWASPHALTVGRLILGSAS